MADESPGPRRAFRSFLYLLLYVSLSIGQILFNKWILSPSYFNFPFPITLTFSHMLLSSIICALVFKVFKVGKLQPGMTSQLYVSAVVPIGVSFAATLWFGNTAFLYLSISFAQMLKATLPVATYLLSVAAKLEQPSWPMFLIMCQISGGVFLSSSGEVSFLWIGVIYQQLGVMAEAIRLILIELLLKKKGLKMDPLTMLFYVSPCSAACLLLPLLFFEAPRLLSDYPTLLSLTSSPISSALLLLNALLTFALNLSVFLVVSHTSALTVRVVGVLKDWGVVLLSAALFADTKLTPMSLLGYGIAVAGVLLYNRQRMASAPQLPASSLSSSSANTKGGDSLQESTAIPKDSTKISIIRTKPVSRAASPFVSSSASSSSSSISSTSHPSSSCPSSPLLRNNAEGDNRLPHEENDVSALVSFLTGKRQAAP